MTTDAGERRPGSHATASEPPRRVSDVFRDVARHPVEYFVRRWNWKTAAGAEGIRGTIFFLTSLPDGLPTALTTLGRDALFRVPLSGAYGSLTQAFRKAEPQRAAMATVFVLLPAVSHLIEFTVHHVGGTPRLGLAMLLSIGFSGLSTLFNLYAMRRGVLVVGDAGSSSFRGDVRRLPKLLLDFVVDGIGTIAGGVRRVRAWVRRRAAKKRV